MSAQENSKKREKKERSLKNKEKKEKEVFRTGNFILTWIRPPMRPRHPDILFVVNEIKKKIISNVFFV